MGEKIPVHGEIPPFFICDTVNDQIVPITHGMLHIHRNEGPQYQDCLEIGTPGKGGYIKVYGDASKPEEFEARMKNMVTLRERAQGLILQPQSGGNQE